MWFLIAPMNNVLVLYYQMSLNKTYSGRINEQVNVGIFGNYFSHMQYLTNKFYKVAVTMKD